MAVRARIARRRSEEGSGRVNNEEKETARETYLRAGKTEENPRSPRQRSFLRRIERADDLPADRRAAGGVH